MAVSSYNLAPQQWAEIHFGDLDLGDLRRNQRVVKVALAFAANPGHSLPQTFPRWYDLKATYNLFAHPQARPDDLQVSHRALVMEALQQAGIYLLIEDTTEMMWEDRQAIAGLGPVGPCKDHQLGFLLHTTLVGRWPQDSPLSASVGRRPVQLLGIADQQYHVRKPRQKGESRRARLSRKRESQLWEQTTVRLGHKPTDEQVRWVRIGDRGADIYDLLSSCEAFGHGFVVRAAQDRAVLDEAGNLQGGLFAKARAASALGQRELRLRARPKQPARIVKVKISATAVCLRAPYRVGHIPGALPPISCTVVRVWEEEAAKGEAALEWILLCDGVQTSLALADQCVQQYATRWLIEEFHKVLKTGLKAEALQLESGQSLMAATAIKSVVAVRLLTLREQGRQAPEAPAQQAGLSEVELEVLAQITGRQLEKVSDVVLALGHLGGHLNRKGDGLPGWITLWRGGLQLQAIVEGVLLAHRLRKFG